LRAKYDDQFSPPLQNLPTERLNTPLLQVERVQ